MTIYVDPGQQLRLLYGGSNRRRRYFASATIRGVLDENGDPYVDTTAFEAAPSKTEYDPDALTFPWTEITDLVDDPQVSFQEVIDSSFGEWRLRLSGHGHRSDLIEEDHAVLIFQQLWPNDTSSNWTGWRCVCLGFITSKNVNDTGAQEGRWTAQIESEARYLRTTDLEPVILSKTNLALNASVSASSTLVDSRLKAGTGEYLGLPDIKPGNVTDPEIAVPWISASEPTLAPEPMIPTEQDGLFKINEVLLLPPVGYGNETSGYQFIELFNTSPDEEAGIYGHFIHLYDQNEDLITSIDMRNLFPHLQEPDSDPFSVRVPPHGFLVICQNRSQLERVYPIQPDAMVVELPRGVVMDPVGGHIRIVSNSTTSDAEIDRFYWGDPTSAPTCPHGGAGDSQGPWEHVEFAADEWHIVYHGEKGDANGNWLNPGHYPGMWVYNWSDANLSRMPAPAAGHSLKRRVAGGGSGQAPAQENNSDTDYWNDWKEEDVPTPGRKQEGTVDGERSWANTEWLRIPMPSLGNLLAEDLVDGDTEVVLNHTNGFYDSFENEALILTTRAKYTSKTATNLVLDTTQFPSGWTGGTVPADTPVNPVDKTGLAHDVWAIKTLEMVRKREPVPVVFSWYTSILPSPRSPSDADPDWTDDWTLATRVSRTLTAKLTQDLTDNIRTMYVDSTVGWPSKGTLFIKTSNGSGGFNTTQIRYLSKTSSSVALEARWTGGTVFAADTNVTISVAASSELTWSRNLDSAVRAQHVLLVIDAMADLGLAIVDEIRVYPDQWNTADPDSFVDGSYVDDLIRHILVDKFGWPASKFTVKLDANGNPSGHIKILDVNTQHSSVWNVLRDLLERTGLFLKFTRAGGAVLRLIPSHPYGNVSGTENEIDWTLTRAHGVAVVGQWSSAEKVSQVVLNYTLAGTSQTGQAKYPPEPASIGNRYDYPVNIIVTGEDVARALAEAIWNDRAAPMEVAFESYAIMMDWLHPLARVALEWDVESVSGLANPQIRYVFVVMSLDESVQNRPPQRHVRTSLRLRRLSAL